jgi:hypothetical protein
MSEIAEFEAAMKAALDPQSQPDPGSGDDRVTSLMSPWFASWCTGCGHTFRLGDRVGADPVTGDMRHLAPGLGCAGEAHPGDQAAHAAELAEFLDGLESTWPVVGDVPVVLSDTQPRLLAPPFGGLRRMYCLYCGDTIRPHELVVVCPCSPGARQCWFPVHRDPGLGLVCWERWKPSGRIDACLRRGS